MNVRVLSSNEFFVYRNTTRTCYVDCEKFAVYASVTYFRSLSRFDTRFVLATRTDDSSGNAVADAKTIYWNN